MIKICEQCHEEFTTRRGTKRYCTERCYHQARTGKTLGQYETKHKDRRAHQWICIDGRQVWLHRYVMEQHLGRPLLPTEVVHHANGDPTDNRISNLVLKESQSAHRREHDTIFRSETHKECTVCHTVKPSEQFTKSTSWPDTWDARVGPCNECQAKISREERHRRKAEWDADPDELRSVTTTCRECGERKGVAGFNWNYAVKNGPPIRQPCKDCLNARRRKK